MRNDKDQWPNINPSYVQTEMVKRLNVLKIHQKKGNPTLQHILSDSVSDSLPDSLRPTIGSFKATALCLPNAAFTLGIQP
ncbi:hypothetical protein TNCV_3168851 [Trichonephila clavipes]|nr:hypothetical protein TNCV_3168851 [Trichonephila clavipes]